MQKSGVSAVSDLPSGASLLARQLAAAGITSDQFSTAVGADAASPAAEVAVVQAAPAVVAAEPSPIVAGPGPDTGAEAAAPEVAAAEAVVA